MHPQRLPSKLYKYLISLQSLHQLGLTPILNMYLCGVESVWGEGASGREVEEYQYEAAWRMTHWGDHIQRHAPFGPTGGRGGYHQSVYNCIAALRDGEPTLVESCLSEARWAGGQIVLYSFCLHPSRLVHRTWVFASLNAICLYFYVHLYYRICQSVSFKKCSSTFTA